MRDITSKQLLFSSGLVADGRLDREEEMVVSSQLKQAAHKIQSLENRIIELLNQLENEQD